MAGRAAGKSKDVAIVGGGIVGCFAAYSLQRAGLSTTVVEPRGIGRQASGQNPGHMNPLHGAGIPGPLADFALQSFYLNLDSWEAIASLSGSTWAGRRRASRVQLELEEGDCAGLEAEIALHEATPGFAVEWLDREAILREEPRLSPDVRRGLLTGGNAVVDSHRYTVAVARAAEALGARIRRAEVTGVGRQGHRLTHLELSDGELRCSAAVFAMGPWSVLAGEWLDLRIPVVGYKGALLLAELGESGIDHDFVWRKAALYRRSASSAWLGGTMEKSGLDFAPSERERSEILAGATRIMPDLERARIVRHTCALRPMTPDQIPVVGAAPGWDNVLFATGTGRKGMLLGAGMGRAIADLVIEGRTSLPIQGFAPGRFTCLGER